MQRDKRHRDTDDNVEPDCKRRLMTCTCSLAVVEAANRAFNYYRNLAHCNVLQPRNDIPTWELLDDECQATWIGFTKLFLYRKMLAYNDSFLPELKTGDQVYALHCYVEEYLRKDKNVTLPAWSDLTPGSQADWSAFAYTINDKVFIQQYINMK